MHHHLRTQQYYVRITTAIAGIAILASVGVCQGPPVYYSHTGSGFGMYERARDIARFEIVEPLGAGTSVELTDEKGTSLQAIKQRVKVLGPPSEPVRHLIVIACESSQHEVGLRLQAKYFLLYLKPKNGRVRLNTGQVVPVQGEEVAGQLAIPTQFAQISPGSNFDERLFSSIIDAVSGLEVMSSTEMMEKLPNPPGMDFYNPTAPPERKMNDYLTGLSDRVVARGGIFSVVFHSRLVVWQIKGSGKPLLDAVFANISDARLEDALSWRLVTVYGGDLQGTQYDPQKSENQIPFLESAGSTPSDAAAALLARLVHNPLREETRNGFVSLLRRGLPRLRAAVCNILALATDKRERLVPVEKDADGWEERVAAMARLWLREYGLGG